MTASIIRNRPARLPVIVGLLLTLCAIAALLVALSSSAAADGPVSVFPTPGDPVAPPGSQITFRGISSSQIGAVTVTGSASGVHSGHLAGDSDGQGASFLPDHPFTPGETVTVSTGLQIQGLSGGSYSFTVARPAPGRLPSLTLPPMPRVRGDVYRFVSRPDLVPAAVRVTHRPRHAAGGDLFLAPQNGPVQNGAMVLGSYGGLLWFKPAPRGQTITDVREQSYQGKPVLTWWQGRLTVVGSGDGVGVINDTAYHQIASVRAGNGLQSDLHEFQLTPQGTALITAYQPVVFNGSTVLDSVVQEIDIPTGLVLFQWDSLASVPVGDSFQPRPPASKHLPYDYFHVNSVQPAPDGNLVVSGRNVWAVFDISPQTGAVNWQLGGRHSLFHMGRGTTFAFQHDARLQADGQLTLFDDAAGPPVTRKQSRAITLRLDIQHKTATLSQQDQHQPGLLAFFEGNAQRLPNGDLFVGWGQQPYLTEFDSAGHTVFDARFVGANSTYRAYRFLWTGMPLNPPAIGVRSSRGGARAYLSWNGASLLTRWNVLAGRSATALRSVGTVRRRSFEVSAALPRGTRYAAAQALDAGRHVLGTTRTVRVR